GRDAYLHSVQALWRLAPGSRFEAGWHWLAIAAQTGVYRARRFGTLPDGGAFESEFLAVVTADRGRATRLEIFEIDAVDAALGRFRELARRPVPGARPDPLRIPANAATRAFERHMARVEAGDWDAVQALHAPSLVFDDRRRGLRTTVDRDGYLAGLQWAGSGMHAVHTLLATPGDRLALWHNRFSRTREVLLFEVETLAVHEVDAEGRLVAVVVFDPDARAAADAELNERFLRSDMHRAPPQVVAFARAVNRRDLAGVRAALPDDFVLDDRRRIGLGRIEGVDAYLASFQALLELTPDAQIGDLYQVVDAAHGRVAVTRVSGTNREGGPFEILYVVVLRYRAGRLAVLEFHDLEDLDQVVARCTGLDPAAAQ
ncbi:MAG: nuclear transport factor 2 family protein, partial [Candidatus Binatia bacterium]